MPVHEVSIGDYVLAGGEAAVLVIIEAVARLLPGVLGNAESHRDDSFAPGAMADLLEGPVYTKPPSGAAAASPRCCSAATTARSPAGAGTRRSAAPPPNRPDLIERCDPAAFDKKDREALLADPGLGSRAATADFGAGPRPWKNRPLLSVRRAPLPQGDRRPAGASGTPNPITTSRR